MITLARPRATRAVALLLGGVAAMLFPWALLVNAALPSHHVASHWDVAWTGFDVALAIALLTVAVGLWHGRRWLPPVAAIVGTMLVCDAWFDVLTSSTRTEMTVATGLALAAELPLAVVCFALAFGRRS